MFFRFDPARLITKCLLCGFAAITVIVCIGALFPNKGDAAPQGSNALPTKKAECNHAQLMSKRAYTSKHPGKARII